jgi:putative PIN family toxin of toxin-antitoxin system
VLRVTLDTNVIISGFYRSGNPRRILDLAQSGAITIAVSKPILEEVADVLKREKFGWSAGEVNYALDRLLEVARVVEPKNRLDVVKADPDDNHILECAVASGSDYLVTGDKHLLEIGKYSGVRIVTPAEFVEIGRQAARNV